MAVVRWLVLALQFCTVLPTPSLKRVPTDHEVRISTLFYPLIGGALGSVLWAVTHLLEHRSPWLLTAVLAVLVSTVVTGGLHLDGLMDTFDAIGSRQPSPRALDIMRDSRVGAMGVLAGCLALVLKTAAVGALVQAHASLSTFILIPSVSRSAMVLSMNLAPYARNSTGLGAVFSQKLPDWVIFLAFAWPVVAMIVFHTYRYGAELGLFATALAIVVSLFCRRRFGGMTGDTYGALQEIVEITGWCISVFI